jgi:hypothetical protein
MQTPGAGAVPTEDMARKVLENRYKEDLAGGLVRLLSVRKTDATDGGTVIHCDVEFEFLKNWKWNPREKMYR